MIEPVVPAAPAVAAEPAAPEPIPLSSLRAGAVVRFRDTVLDPHSCNLLRALGLTRECQLTLCKVGDPCIVQVRSTRIGIWRTVADGILRRSRGRRRRADMHGCRRPRGRARRGAPRATRPASPSSAIRTPARPRSSIACAARGPRPRTSPAPPRPSRVGRPRCRGRPARRGARPARTLRARPRRARVADRDATCWRAAAAHRQPDAVLVVVDACNLTRNLVLVGRTARVRHARSSWR